jgi:hypothetical protein
MSVGDYQEVAIVIRKEIQDHKTAFATMENEALFVIRLRNFAAKYAPRIRLIDVGDISHSPWRPQLIHAPFPF